MKAIIDLIIKQEKQLFLRKDPISVLSELVDDEFMEIGSSSEIHDKEEVIRWLGCEDPSEVQGLDFKATFLSENILLLTYTSTTTSPYLERPKQARRSSIWRRTLDKWQMVFHQGTPIA